MRAWFLARGCWGSRRLLAFPALFPVLVQFVVLALFCVAVGGCSTSRLQERLIRWEEQVQPPAAPAGGKTRLAASAAFVPSALTCEAEARAALATDPAKGWAKLLRCVQDPAFSELKLLLRMPWSNGRPPRFAMLQVLVRVLANRGGDLENDRGLLRAAGVTLLSFDDVVDDPARFQGQMFLAHGVLVTDEFSPQDAILVEKVWGNSGAGFSVACSRFSFCANPALEANSPRPSGRLVQVTKGRAAKAPQVFLLRVQGARDRRDEDQRIVAAEETESDEVELVLHSPPVPVATVLYSAPSLSLLYQ